MEYKQHIRNLFFKVKDVRECHIQKKECNSIIQSVKSSFVLSKEYKREIQDYFSRFYNGKISTLWHELYYKVNGSFDVRYIPIDLLFTRIIPQLNISKFSGAYSDKSRYNLLFPNIMHPKTILKKVNGCFYKDDYPITLNEAIKELPVYDSVVVKPTIDTSKGEGVKILECDKLRSDTDREKFLIDNGNNYIIQEKLNSYKILSSLNKSSLNTIRVNTYRKDNEVKLLSATLKIGKSGEIVDNGHQGGFFCGVTNEGYLKPKLYTLNPFSCSYITENGLALDGLKIPNFDYFEHKIKECALRLPYSRYAGWDIAINELGEPVLIEVNLKCPGGNIMQIPNGPLFGDFTEEILSEIKK